MDTRYRRWMWLGAGVGAVLATRQLLRRLRAMSLVGKTVLITGGSRGLGLLLARQFGAEGARVVICARHLGELERARQDLAGRGVDVLVAPCDVTDRSQVRGMFATVREHFGPIDVVVNNAGVVQVGPLDAMTEEDFEQALQVHFWAPLYTMLEALPDMRRRRSGRIVNVASVGGKISVPHLLPYSASKFALVGLSEGLRAELAQDGVFVTTVCPGLMRTGSHIHAYMKGRHSAEFALFSILDGLPITSINAARAARSIVAACKNGDPELILSVPAQAAVLFHGAFPGAAAELLALVNRALPGAGHRGIDAIQGKDIQSMLSPSILTALIDRAARENNETEPDANGESDQQTEEE